MADDIVTRYRTQARRCNHGHPNGLGDCYPAPTSCNLCSVALEAADEIERLRAELRKVCPRCRRGCHEQHGFVCDECKEAGRD